MSKRPAKRKASYKAKYYADADDGNNNLAVDSTASLLASLDLSNSKTTPRESPLVFSLSFPKVPRNNMPRQRNY